MLILNAVLRNFKKLFVSFAMQQTDNQQSEKCKKPEQHSKAQKYFEIRKFLPIFAPAKAKFGSLGEWLKPPVC